MPSREEVPRLVKQLRRGMLERLAARGWASVEPVSKPPAVGKFVSWLRDGFGATAVFPFLRNDDSGDLIVVGRLGLDYEPARELLVALTGSEISGVLLNEPTNTASISSATDVADAAQRLADFVCEQGIPLARRYAHVDALVELLRDDLAVPFNGRLGGVYAYQAMAEGRTLALRSAQAELIPALLTVAGRHDEARAALTNCVSLGGQDSDTREYRRFARQLTRRLDADGDPPLPDTPARWPSRPATPGSRTSFRQAFTQGRRDAHAQKEALDAVRAVSQGKSHDEIRALLQSEIAERGLTLDPLTIEHQVAVLMAEGEPFGRARSIRNGLKELSDLVVAGAEFRKLFREGFAPPPDPEWLKAPDRAAYPVSSVAPRWTAVELDPQARAWLDRIAEANRRRLPGSRDLDVWLTWDPVPSTGEARLRAHIGTECVGRLSPEATECLRPVMNAAAQRDEDPYMRGRLNGISDQVPYLLEVAACHDARR